MYRIYYKYLKRNLVLLGVDFSVFISSTSFSIPSLLSSPDLIAPLCLTTLILSPALSVKRIDFPLLGPDKIVTVSFLVFSISSTPIDVKTVPGFIETVVYLSSSKNLFSDFVL
jgi:hypothetical protein